MKTIEEEYRQSFRRFFDGQDLDITYVHFDGHAARNEFLRDGWNFAIDKGWLRVVESTSDEQDNFLKGYLTEQGRKDVLEK